MGGVITACPLSLDDWRQPIIVTDESTPHASNSFDHLILRPPETGSSGVNAIDKEGLSNCRSLELPVSDEIQSHFCATEDPNPL